MTSYLHLENKQTRPLPPDLHDYDVRYPDALVTHFLSQHTQPGAVVLDPFAGFGTTLIVAEQMDRIGYGIEWDARKVQYIQSQLAHGERIIQGDARNLLRYKLPAFDFCMTSPPYTHRGEQANALSNYEEDLTGYDQYLAQMQTIYCQMAQMGKPGAKVIIEIANIKHESAITTLAWDVARVVAEVLVFEGEIVVCWDRYDYGYDHSYCLIYHVA